MNNKSFWQRIIFLGMIFGLMFLSCIRGTTNSKVDTALNGTWLGKDKSGSEIEMKLRNGKFELSSKSNDGDIVESKGNYTTDNGKITMNTNQSRITGSSEFIKELGLESKWYTNNELIIIFKSIFEGYGISEKDISEIVNLMISPPEGKYSVDGKSLIITTTYGGQSSAVILNKK